MKRALVASLAFHGVLGAALLSFELGAGKESNSESTNEIAIEVIAPPRDTPPLDIQGGGSFHEVAGPNVRASDANVRVTDSVAQAAQKRGRTPLLHNGELAVRMSDVVFDHGGTGSDRDRDGDGGEGFGTGGNRGDGIGLGDGKRIAIAEDEFVLPGAPKDPPKSKARPAKLIYPKRERDLGADKLFIARITVDTDGYVVGARLLRGYSSPRDAEAADLIFKFRYSPALDDAGRAIASTFEQPFHVNR